jgi:hypothetical protein
MIIGSRLQHPILELEGEEEFLYSNHCYELCYVSYSPHSHYTVLSLG